MTDAPAPYLALALQCRCDAINAAPGPTEARSLMMAAILRLRAMILAAKGFIGSDLKLVVLPEYVLTGFPMGDSAAGWVTKAALHPDGAEYLALGEIARAADIHLAGNAYEQDDNFPGFYFQTSFLIGPDGRILLHYRRLISLFSPSPYDVYDRYVALYGKDSLFPVADTPLGRIAAIASEEILYPELARGLALRGAELFIHSSSETASPMPTAKNIAKQARAIENLAYVVSANTAGIAGINIPTASTEAGSKIVDYRGLVLAEAGYGESMAACAEIDIAGLRRYRSRPGMGNLLARQPLALWHDAYDCQEIHPVNGLLDQNGTPQPPPAGFFPKRQREVIARMESAGLI